MRKLFRMKYESCTGQCYAHSDVMKIHTLGLDLEGAVTFLKKLLQVHGPSCGNDSIQFRLDADEFERDGYREAAQVGLVPTKNKDVRFVASFYHYGSLDLFAGDTPLEAMNKMMDAALAWYESDEGFGLVERDSPNAWRANVCHHGTDDKLINFAIEFSGLDDKGKAELRDKFL